MKTLFDQEKTRLLAQGHKMVPVILNTDSSIYAVGSRDEARNESEDIPA